MMRIKRNVEYLARIDKSLEELNAGKTMSFSLEELTEWDQRMDEANRLVYQIDELQNIKVISCRGHYEE